MGIMDNRRNTWQRRLNAVVLKTVAVAAVAAAAVLAYVLGCKGESPDTVAVEADKGIGITPVQIKAIENIGEWEFLSVSDEEIVDTVRHGFFGDDELVRIYYGVARLGIDMRKVGDGWLTLRGDTLVARVPRVELLDSNFIDEARTRSFIEKGKWSNADRADMYRRAFAAMRGRAMAKGNVDAARRNAEVQLRNLFRSLGADNVSVTFE